MIGFVIRQFALLAVALAVIVAASASNAHAYTYAPSGEEPLLDGREALFAALAKGDWAAAQKALDGMDADVDYLDAHEAPGIAKAFDDAAAAKDAGRIRSVFVEAASAEIRRRIDGAQQSLQDYPAAKVLVVKAQRFYTAIAGDLAPDKSKAVGDALRRALDAIGNPGIFGVGAKKADPAAFAAARDDLLKALGAVTGSAAPVRSFSPGGRWNIHAVFGIG